ncbi:hypothetical protein [Virgibacillus sediminis]|uniref:Sporulation histidine kinase inhibitor Sda n=1 Tax=Virgibacillus sediminis TaxID=202260 RepID=A0ABV7A9L1_9BACI
MRYQTLTNKNLVIEIEEQELAMLAEALEKSNPDMKILSELDQILFAYHRELEDKVS